MGAIGSIFTRINPILQALGAMATVVGALTGGVRAVKLPVYKIPTEDLEMLKRQIQGNVRISDEARAIALQALESYRTGTLSPVYEDLFNRWYREAEARLREELARRGFAEGSTLYREAMNRLAEEANAYRAQLLQKQLQDALTATGLSETTINELLRKWSAEAGVAGAQAQAILAQEYLRGLEAERLGRIGEALSKVGETIGRKPEEEKRKTETPRVETPRTEEADLERILRGGTRYYEEEIS